jgi:hypothetical protein
VFKKRFANSQKRGKITYVCKHDLLAAAQWSSAITERRCEGKVNGRLVGVAAVGRDIGIVLQGSLKEKDRHVHCEM